MGLRSHQKQLQEAIREKGKDDLPLSILAWVVPGGGKTWLPGIVGQRFPDFRIAWFVPRLTLRSQACRDMLDDFNIELRESDNTVNPARNSRGFAATQQSLTGNPDLYIQELERHPYILVTDEIHHAKISPNGGGRNELATALDRLAPLARVHLKMTGTLEPNDSCRIWGCQYDEIVTGYAVVPERSADILIRYDRKTALSEGAIVPIEFHHHDGPAKWIDGDNKVPKEVTLSKARNDDEARKALFTALKTELAEDLFEAGVADWERRGQDLLIVCESQATCRKYAKEIQRRGHHVALAITDEGPDALEAIQRLKKGQCRVLVTCAMAYEGLNHKPFTHVICLTHIRSVPWLEQMFGRIWRAADNKARCLAFVPDDIFMRAIIERIRRDTPRILTRIEQGGDKKGGAGGGPPSVIPVSSSLAGVRSELLDGELARTLMRGEAVAALDRLGLSPDSPIIDQVVAAMEAQRQYVPRPATALTPTEREKRYRKGIHSACCEADRRKGVDYGTHQKELFRKMNGRKLSEMSLEELERAAACAANLCA